MKQFNKTFKKIIANAVLVGFSYWALYIILFMPITYVGISANPYVYFPTAVVVALLMTWALENA